MSLLLISSQQKEDNQLPTLVRTKWDFLTLYYGAVKGSWPKWCGGQW